MNNELILRQFDEIEQKIEALVAERESLKAANLEFSYKVEDLETKLEAKLAEETQNTETKRLIESKIDSLISRLGDVGEQNE